MNRVLVAPTEEELAVAVWDAVTAANRGGKRRPIEFAPGEIGTAVRAALLGPQADNVYWRRPDRQASVVWWADPAGRRHVRVRGGGNDGREPPWDAAEHFAVIYPGVLQRCGPHAVVACGCGAVGTLDAVGWAGERCGPCQDRADEGGPVTPAQVFPGGNEYQAIAFTPDGRRLICCHAVTDRVVLRDLRTGATTEAPIHDRSDLTAVALGPAGRAVLVFDSGRAFVLDHTAEAATVSIPGPDPGMVRASTCGQFLTRWDGSVIDEVDWSEPCPRFRPVCEIRDAAGSGFDRAGVAWVFLTTDDHLVRIHLKTGSRDVVASDVFAGTPLWVGADAYARMYAHPLLVAAAPEYDLACVAAAGDPSGCAGPLMLGSLTLARPWRMLASDGNRTAVHRIEFSPCGGYLFAGDDRGLIVYAVSDPDSPVRLAAQTDAGQDAINALAFSPDGETLAVGFETAGDPMIRLLPWRRLVALAGEAS